MRCLVIASLLASGCVFHGDDDDCDYGGVRPAEGDEAGLEAPTPQYRNPDTGQCVVDALPPDCSCDACGNCPPCAYEEPPDWGECTNYCAGLNETTCLATEGCRGAYLTACAARADCPDDSYAYYGCWATARSGVVRGGDCTALDAYQCSRHDDCVVRHTRIAECGDCPGGSSDPTVGPFESCAPEQAAPPACAELDEAACVEREDCAPYYEGVDCTCEGDICSCAEWVFQGCE